MAKTKNRVSSNPLYEKIVRSNIIPRVLDATILLLLLSLLSYRLFSPNKQYGVAWILALLCELWFTFTWILTINCKWNQVVLVTYPQRLSQSGKELPAVDMFVTTADPVLEPPIITVNTVISLLAVNYPANKLACYVSDDGCSPITYYALLEASKFAKLWVPFCKQYNVQDRAPFRFFSNHNHKQIMSVDGDGIDSLEFQRDSMKMKEEYNKLTQKINDASENSIPSIEMSGDFDVFSNVELRNHPPIIRVIWENKEDIEDGLPHLVYISREKRPKHAHHYKAGAMNVLGRVSGIMTNAPYMLNVDCDMFVNNADIVKHAMCMFLGCDDEKDVGFVQSPQQFYNAPDDHLHILQEYMGSGIAGIQGPFYGGSGCFHRRKTIYGLCPKHIGHDQAKNLTPIHGDLDENELMRIFGESKELIKSASLALQGKTNETKNLSFLVNEANQVASIGYELRTSWGKEIGWLYGAVVEDVVTGMIIHTRGWASVYCTPSPPAFLGNAPSLGPALMVQRKRWGTGLLEIFFSEKSPIICTLFGHLKLRQFLAYMWVQLWAARSIPEICYMVLPAYCLITNSHFLPKVHERELYIYSAIILLYVMSTSYEYIVTGISIKSWWKNQTTARIISINAWPFGVLAVILKVLGVTGTVFEITQKDEASDGNSGGDYDYDDGFIFDGSLYFLPGTTMVLIHLASWVVGFIGLLLPKSGGGGFGLGEVVCSVLVMLLLWPIVKGFVRKGKYGIPLSTICKSSVLALFLAYVTTSIFV